MLIHMDDGLTEYGEEWTPCRSRDCAWVARTHESCSLISTNARALYGNHGGMGFVLSPYHAQIMCSFPGDGGTQGTGVNGENPCARGADAPDPPCRADSPADTCFCAGPITPGYRRYWDCSFPPDDGLADMIARQLSGKHDRTCNEVIVSSRFWASALPELIEAIVDFGGSGERARDVHARFLRHFGRTREQHPLLSWSPGGGFKAM